MKGLWKMDPQRIFVHEQSGLISSVQFNRSVMPNSLWLHGLLHARLPWQFITNFWSLLKLMSIKSVMPPNHLILCCPLLLLPSIFPSIRVFKGLWKIPKKGFVHDKSGLTKPKINFNYITTSYIDHSLNLFFVFKLCFVSPCCICHCLHYLYPV